MKQQEELTIGLVSHQKKGQKANANFSIAKKVDGAFEVGNGDRAKISLTASNAKRQKQRERKGRRI